MPPRPSHDANTLSSTLERVFGWHRECQPAAGSAARRSLRRILPDADFGTVSVNLWARNLTDTKYTVFGLENVKGGNYIGQRGNPIQFGLDCRLKF